MKKTEKYLQAEGVVIQPEKYDHRDVYRAQAYLDAYQDGYNVALSLFDVIERFSPDSDEVEQMAVDLDSFLNNTDLRQKAGTYSKQLRIYLANKLNEYAR